MSDLIDLNQKRQEKEDSELMFYNHFYALCTHCFSRWVAFVEDGTNLFKLQCPSCYQQNSFCAPIPDNLKPNSIVEWRD